MAANFSNVQLAGLLLDEGALNTSGIQEDAFWIPLTYIATLQIPKSDPANPVEAMEITTAHVLKAGKSPIPLFTSHDKSGMDSPTVGEKFSKISQPVVKLFQPQPTPENAANYAVMTNQRGILLIKRAIGGDYIQIGNKGLLAVVKEGSVKFGDGPTGAPGIEFQIEASSVMPYYVYKAALPVAGV
jgi:hypothetical protein